MINQKLNYKLLLLLVGSLLFLVPYGKVSATLTSTGCEGSISGNHYKKCRVDSGDSKEIHCEGTDCNYTCREVEVKNTCTEHVFVPTKTCGEWNDFVAFHPKDCISTSPCEGEGCGVFDTSDQDKEPSGITFSDTGSRMFITGQEYGKVYQYDLQADFANTLASFDGSFDPGWNEDHFNGVKFSPNGWYMYLLNGEWGGVIVGYELSTPFDVTSTHQQLNSFTPPDYPTGFSFNSDGSKIYVAEYNKEAIDVYELETNYKVDPFSASDSPVNSFDLDNVGSYGSLNPYDVEFNSDGTKMYVMGGHLDEVLRFQLSTPYDLSTATFDSAFDPEPLGIYYTTSLAFSEDYSRMYITTTNITDPCCTTDNCRVHCFSDYSSYFQ